MGHKKRHHRDLERAEGPADFSIQATPLILRDLGWTFVRELADAVYDKFEAHDFRKLIFHMDGTTVADALGHDVPVKCFFACLKDFTDVQSDRALMITPYLDKDNIKVLYFKWADETLYDSFAVPDGQNRIWDNKE